MRNINVSSIFKPSDEKLKKQKAKPKPEPFPEILYGKILRENTSGFYLPERNLIVIDITPEKLKPEYKLYGLKGIIRDLSATVIHELTHWATSSLDGHEWKRMFKNPYRCRGILTVDYWTYIIHSILYDLQRTQPKKTYIKLK